MTPSSPSTAVLVAAPNSHPDDDANGTAASDLEQSIRFYAAQPDAVVAQRIEQLKQEWSLDRYAQAKTAAIGLLTVGLAATGTKKWAWLTCVALACLLQRGLLGLPEPNRALRKLGLRTRRDLNQEIYALKAMRGDFAAVPAVSSETQSYPVEKVLAAVKA